MEETFEKIDGGRGDGWTGATQQVGEVTRIRLLGFELGNVGVAFEGLFHILHVVVFEVAHNFEDTLDLGVLSLLFEEDLPKEKFSDHASDGPDVYLI